MMNSETLDQMRVRRGPRYLVHGTIRRGEMRATYALDAAAAERIAAEYKADGLYQVQITPPVQHSAPAAMLREIGGRWRAARDVERDLAQQVYAAIRAASADGLAQTTIAETAGVDRMTVRRALGLLP